MILALLLFFFLSPLTAWAYFDPGFGGYLISSIISLIVTCLAFVSAAIIYFFRTIIGQRLLFLWQKHEKFCLIMLLSFLGLGSFFLGTFLHYAFYKSSFYYLFVKLRIVPILMVRAYLEPDFGRHLSIFIISLNIIGLAFMIAVAIYVLRAIIDQKFLPLWQKYQKLRIIILLSAFSLISVLAGAFLLHTFHNPSANYSHPSETRIIDPQRIYKGYSLFNGTLIDEQGRIVKQWSNLLLGVIDKNGDYYGQQYFEAPLWGRYTWDNKVVWEKHFFIHHEIYLSPTGTIFTFTKEVHRYNGHKVDFDVILEFDKNGKELQRFSFWDHLKEFQPYHAKFAIDAAFPVLPLWAKPYKDHSRGSYDYFHLNSFFMIPPNPLEGKDPAFRPGNWLISVLHGSMVFILDQDTKKVLWHAAGNEIEDGLEGQHSASMLPDGNILLFENGVSRWHSRILMIDPLTLKIKWQYNNKDFFSSAEGFVQALPNGNFLITESYKGHAFELTPDKKIVWDYYYPDDIYRMTRYPKEMIDRLLKK